MWKVTITEIQEAGALERTRVPAGAFFVSTERFSRTVDDLDLQALIQTIDRMQAPDGCRREDRSVWGEKILPRAVSLRSADRVERTEQAWNRRQPFFPKLIHDLQ